MFNLPRELRSRANDITYHWALINILCIARLITLRACQPINNTGIKMARIVDNNTLGKYDLSYQVTDIHGGRGPSPKWARLDRWRPQGDYSGLSCPLPFGPSLRDVQFCSIQNRQTRDLHSNLFRRPDKTKGPVHAHGAFCFIWRPQGDCELTPVDIFQNDNSAS